MGSKSVYICKKEFLLQVKQFIKYFIPDGLDYDICSIDDAIATQVFAKYLTRVKLLQVFQCFHNPYDLPRIKEQQQLHSCFVVRTLVLLRNSFCRRVLVHLHVTVLRRS